MKHTFYIYLVHTCTQYNLKYFLKKKKNQTTIFLTLVLHSKCSAQFYFVFKKFLGVSSNSWQGLTCSLENI
jgi:hypothetical protein